MDHESIQGWAFLDELEKIAVAHGRMTVSKSRDGRRPISVSNLLKKEKDGELYKSTGNEQKIANQVPFSVPPPTGAEVNRPRRKGDIPSKEDMDTMPKREDGRGNAATIPSPGAALNDVGVSNTDRA